MKDLLPAAPTFDQPLKMLYACHDRIRAQCETLHRLVSYLLEQGNDTQATQAARAILRYFDTAGQHHHQDEEQDLFPALLAEGDSEAAKHVARLLEEHQALDAAWQALRPQLAALAEERGNTLDAGIATHFIDRYTHHIAFENGSLLPLAQTLLDAKTLERIGRNMAIRRGLGASP